MSVGACRRQWCPGVVVLAVGLGLATSGCGLAGRGAEYRYEPWDVSASGTGNDSQTAPSAAASAARSTSAGDSTGAGADSGSDVAALRTQVRELREREQALLQALDSSRTRSARESPDDMPRGEPAAASSSTEPHDLPREPEAANGGTDLVAERIAALHAELAEERRRRQAAEMQLDRLRRETSQAPFGAPAVPESAFLAAKQEIVYLRQALTEEKQARQKLAEDFDALQRELARRPATAVSAGDGRSAQLESRTGEAAASFQRTLVATEAESAALERELAAAAAGADDEPAAVRAENALLRERLEEQRRRTQDLATKLKLAVRVTDLIFKLDSQSRGKSARQSRPTRAASSTRAAKPRRNVAPAAPAVTDPVPAPAAPAKSPREESAPKPGQKSGDSPYPI